MKIFQEILNLLISQKMSTMSGQDKAFTLAEVLITIGVIGIVAALTIPTLIKNTQDMEFKTAWKKAYSDINQATQKIIEDNGGDLVNLCTIGNIYDNDCFRNAYLNYMSYIQKCDTDSIITQCWTSEPLGDRSLDTINGSRAILNNGSFIYFNYRDKACADTFFGNIPGGYCGIIQVDVNGYNGPNISGKDIFSMWATKNKIAPFGTKGITWGVTCNPTSNIPGYGCAAKYLYQ